MKNSRQLSANTFLMEIRLSELHNFHRFAILVSLLLVNFLLVFTAATLAMDEREEKWMDGDNIRSGLLLLCIY